MKYTMTLLIVCCVALLSAQEKYLVTSQKNKYDLKAGQLFPVQLMCNEQPFLHELLEPKFAAFEIINRSTGATASGDGNPDQSFFQVNFDLVPRKPGRYVIEPMEWMDDEHLFYTSQPIVINVVDEPLTLSDSLLLWEYDEYYRKNWTDPNLTLHDSAMVLFEPDLKIWKVKFAEDNNEVVVSYTFIYANLNRQMLEKLTDIKIVTVPTSTGLTSLGKPERRGYPMPRKGTYTFVNNFKLRFKYFGTGTFTLPPLEIEALGQSYSSGPVQVVVDNN